MMQQAAHQRPKIVELVCTCEFFPWQWEGRLKDGRPIYIRQRSGPLTVNIGPIGGTVADAAAAGHWFETEGDDDADDSDGDTLGYFCRLAGLSIGPELLKTASRMRPIGE